MRVLVVEDEAALRSQLLDRLRENGWVTEAAEDGEVGLHLGREYPFDVGVIDLGLPGISGMELIRRLRAEKKTFPILILTARNRWQDKVEGLEAGADDYLVKPFHIEELLARLRALMRRGAGWSQPRLVCGPMTLDTSAQEVTVEGRAVELTSYEYRTIELLMLHAGDVIAKEAIAEHLYQEDLSRDSNVIEVLVGRLRRKLDPDDHHRPIETVRGRGYRFTLGERQS